MAREPANELTFQQRQRLRAWAELVVSRLWLLTGRTRAIMAAYYDYGLPLRTLGKLTDEPPKSLRSLVKRVARELVGDRFLQCMSRRADLTQRQLELARLDYLEGLRQREIAEKWGCSEQSIGRAIRSLNAVAGIVIGPSASKPEKGDAHD